MVVRRQAGWLVERGQHVFTRLWQVCQTVSLALLLVACRTDNGQQVLRHLVIAELMQKEHIPETYIRIEDVRVENRQAVVRVTIRGQGGRMGSVRTYHCELEREADRWVIRGVQEN